MYLWTVFLFVIVASITFYWSSGRTGARLGGICAKISSVWSKWGVAWIIWIIERMIWWGSRSIEQYSHQWLITSWLKHKFSHQSFGIIQTRAAISILKYWSKILSLRSNCKLVTPRVESRLMTFFDFFYTNCASPSVSLKLEISSSKLKYIFY